MTLSDPTTATPSFTAPTGPASLTFQLVVNDGQRLSDPSTVVVTVSTPTNRAPVASAGPPKTVSSGAIVALDGSASSDPDGDALTYQWTQLSGTAVTLSDPTTATPSFTAPTGPASLTFQLIVNDGKVASAPSTVTVTVKQPNRAPTANAGTGQTVLPGATVHLDGTGSSDPDGDALTFLWTQQSGPAVTLSSSTATAPTFTSPAGPTSLSFTLVVSDGALSSSPATVTIAVQGPPSAPASFGATASPLGPAPPTVALSWNAVGSNPTVLRYRIERSTNAGFTGQPTTFTVNAPAAAMTDTSVVKTTTYYYRVRAENALGVSAWTDARTVVTPGQTVPAAPTITGGTGGRSTATIGWTAPTGGGQTRYYIERATKVSGPFVQVANVAGTVTSYTNQGLARRTTYYYRVKAANAIGTGAPSNVFAVTTQ